MFSWSSAPRAFGITISAAVAGYKVRPEPLQGQMLPLLPRETKPHQLLLPPVSPALSQGLLGTEKGSGNNSPLDVELQASTAHSHTVIQCPDETKPHRFPLLQFMGLKLFFSQSFIDYFTQREADRQITTLSLPLKNS